MRKKLISGLYSLLAVISWGCTPDLNTAPHHEHLIEVYGVLDLDSDHRYVLGGLAPEIEDLLLEVEQEVFRFTSTRYRFYASLSVLQGGTECEDHIYTGSQAAAMEGGYYLEFAPPKAFFECLEYMECPHDEVIGFTLYLDDMEL